MLARRKLGLVGPAVGAGLVTLARSRRRPDALGDGRDARLARRGSSAALPAALPRRFLRRFRRRASSPLSPPTSSRPDRSLLRGFASDGASSFVDVEATRAARGSRRQPSARGGGEAQSSAHVFDRVVKAAQAPRGVPPARAPSRDVTDPFLEEVTGRLLDRLADVNERSPALVLGGASDAVVGRLLSDRPTSAHRRHGHLRGHARLRPRQRRARARRRAPTTRPSSRASAADARAKTAPPPAAYSSGARSGETRPGATTIHFVRCDEEALRFAPTR